MSRIRKLILLTVASVIELIVMLVLLFNNLIFYVMFTLVLLIITLGYLFYYYWNTRSEDAIYKSSLNEILKNYNSILVKIICLPDFGERNLVRVANLDDLIVAQMEIRKPISYFEELDSCTFILLDNKEAYIYVLRKNNIVRPIIENYLNNAKKERPKSYSNLLSDIDKTTIIKLENSKSYRISPIRKKKKQEIEVLSLDNEVI